MPYTEDDYKVYMLAQRVAQIVREEITRENHPDLLPIFPENPSPNPFHYQVEIGLVLESLTTVFTPWGEWRFITTITEFQPTWSNIFSRLTERLGLKILNPERDNETEPQYAICSVDGRQLPEPVFKDVYSYMNLHDAGKAWLDMTLRYREEMNN